MLVFRLFRCQYVQCVPSNDRPTNVHGLRTRLASTLKCTNHHQSRFPIWISELPLHHTASWVDSFKSLFSTWPPDLLAHPMRRSWDDEGHGRTCPDLPGYYVCWRLSWCHHAASLEHGLIIRTLEISPPVIFGWPGSRSCVKNEPFHCTGSCKYLVGVCNLEIAARFKLGCSIGFMRVFLLYIHTYI